MKYNVKRTEKMAKLNNPKEGIPQQIREAHLEFVLTMMESVYDSEGLDGLMNNRWTDTLIKYATLKGVVVDKNMLRERIESHTPVKKEGTFFTDLRDALLEMRSGLTADKKIRANIDMGSYVV